jgi:hypothetical protein
MYLALPGVRAKAAHPTPQKPLPVEPDVFHAPVVAIAVDHDRQGFHSAQSAGTAGQIEYDRADGDSLVCDLNR